MGACLSWRTYRCEDAETAKTQFKNDQESDRLENGCSYSGGIGMCDGISGKVHVFATGSKAVEFVSDNAEKFGEALVTRFKENGDTKFLIGGLCSS